jgi:hypothetical protein
VDSVGLCAAELEKRRSRWEKASPEKTISRTLRMQMPIDRWVLKIITTEEWRMVTPEREKRWGAPTMRVDTLNNKANQIDKCKLAFMQKD